jgi:hypothetical protein
MLRHIMFWKYVVAVAVIFGCARYVSEHYQRSAQQCEDKAAQIYPRISSPSMNAEYANNCKDEAERSFPRWYRLFSWPEGITTWAVLLTLIVVAEQTRETSRSAEEAKNAAVAAARGVDATINAERAWIIATIENAPKWIPEANRLEFMVIAPIFRNYGRTPGRITRARARVHYLAESEELPPEPVYEAENWYMFRFDGEAVLPPISVAIQPLQIKLDGLTFPNVVQGKLRLFVYWQIDYRDVFGYCWYDRACYEFHVPGGFDTLKEGFYVSGGAPKSYNQSPEKPVDCPNDERKSNPIK